MLVVFEVQVIAGKFWLSGIVRVVVVTTRYIAMNHTEKANFCCLGMYFWNVVSFGSSGYFRLMVVKFISFTFRKSRLDPITDKLIDRKPNLKTCFYLSSSIVVPY